MRVRIIGSVVLLAGACAVVGCASPVPGAAILPDDATIATSAPFGLSAGSSVASGSSGGASAVPQITAAPDPGGSPASSAAGEDRVVPRPSVPVTPMAPQDNDDPGATSGAGNPEAAAFAARIRRAATSLRTLHGTIHLSSTSAATQTETFAETLDHGAVSAADITISLDGRAVRVLVVGTRYYLGPESLLRRLGVDTGGRSWVRMTDTAPNPTVRELAEKYDRTGVRLGPASYIDMAGASTGPMMIGTDTVAGSTATHFRLAVSIGKLVEMGVASRLDADRLEHVGVTQLPVDIWLDARDRPVRMEVEFSARGEHLMVVAELGRFNEPVSIVAPDPADVVTG